MELTRRRVLAGGGAAALGGVAALAVPRIAAEAAPQPAALPAPAASGIDHVIVVMMENRSFDHFLGWVPGADGRQGGLRFVDRYGVPHATWHLTEFQGCSHPDPDHSYEGGRIQFNRGKLDGWLRSGDNDPFAIGYYTASDLDFWRQAGADWTVCDQYFAATMAETYPNRFYQHAGRTDRLHNSTVTSSLPTIWDRLSAAGRTGRYYFSDIPFTALWGSRYIGISAPFPRFLADCAGGTLPDVSFVDPRFVDEASGSSGDDHPHGDIRSGENFLATVYNAVVTSPDWSRTLLIVNYDEWGGFYDHVPPRTAPDADPATALRGFRVPALVVSPRARGGAVAHGVYDHTSVLRAIEWRWGLAPLTARDGAAANLAEVLDFSAPPRLRPPTYTVRPVPTGPPCQAAQAQSAEEWGPLREKAIDDGWRLP
ncbi:MAG: alkaline phosphatase family protein [Frankiales bacterium]|nr:alkaline phosphatase family protein [Frankiales bacterium]